MTMTLTGWHFDDDGSPRNGKTVFYRIASTAEPNPNPIITNTTTDVNGHWSLTVPDGDWDVYLLDGPTVRVWKAGTSLPLHFGNAQIAPSADIDLTKLDGGTLDDDVNPLTYAPTTLEGRLSQIISQLKDMLGLSATDWNSVPSATLWDANLHAVGTDNRHGLPVGVSPVGVGGSGQFFKFGIATVGAESITPTTPTYYIATATVVFPAAFPGGCDGVWVNSQWWAIAASAQGAAANGCTIYLATQIAGQAAGKPVQWLALGH